MTNEEAIKALEHVKSIIKLEITTDQPHKAMEACDVAISALSRDRWISVEEGLPEKYGDYMILWKPKSYRTKKLFYEITEYEDGEWIGKIPQSEPYGGYEVFYWRELPAEPPKEET